MKETLNKILVRLEKLDKIELDVTVLKGSVEKLDKIEQDVTVLKGSVEKLDKIELDVSALKKWYEADEQRDKAIG